MTKAGDLVIDELGNIGILMHNDYIWLLKHSGKPVDVPTLVSYTKVVTVHGDWYRVYVPSVVLGWPGILELAETEEELLDYLKDVFKFTRDEKGNN